MELKTFVQNPANLVGIKSGGIAVYEIYDDKVHTLEIDMTDKNDVGETATFLPHYDRALTLMRWIRRAIENNTLI